MRIIGKSFSFIFGNLKLLLFKIFNMGSFKYQMSDRISPFSTLSLSNGKIGIGKNCQIKSNTIISAVNGSVKIGDNCFINRNCQIVAHESIVIEKNVMIGPNVVILDHDHRIKDGAVEKREYITKKIVIGENAWIGANSVILKGVTIGKGAIVAAGTIVTHNCPADSLMVQKKKTDILKIGDK